MTSPWFRRYPRISLLIVNAAVLILVLFSAELFLRLVVPYNPGYYMSVSGTSREVIYPYGVIKINSLGYPDEEFDGTRAKRVGYFGDSVTYGVGAGYGHRISELLESAYPSYDHLNFGGVGLSISYEDIRRFSEISSEFHLDHAIYLFNLNDIVPTAVTVGEEKTVAVRLRGITERYFDWMRGRSYLYTYLRTKLKNLLETRGVGFHGYEAYELFPHRSSRAVRETAKRIVRLNETLNQQGVDLTVVGLPYEMQISAEAAREYARLGIRWEDGFLDGSTQELISRLLPAQVRWIDARLAFLKGEGIESSRAKNGLGEFFVYDRGDKLDWNHPNREGHRAIARYLVEQEILGPPAGAGDVAAEPVGP